MKSHDRMLAALNLEEPDRVPVMELGVGLEPLFRSLGTAPPEISPAETLSEGIPKPVLRALVKAGLDGYCLWLIPSRMTPVETGLLRDPLGRLFKHLSSAPTTSGNLFYVGGWVKSREDIEQLPELNPYDPTMLTMLNRALKNAGDKLFLVPSTIGLMEATFEPMGFETFSRSLYGDRDFLEAMLDRILEYLLGFIDAVSEYEVHAILFGDDSGDSHGPFIRPEHYRRLILPRLKKLVDECHRHGVLYIEHTDGNVMPLLDMFVEAGVDAVQSWEPLAGMDIRYGKERYGGKLCIIGNVDVGLLSSASPEQVSRYVRNCIKTAAPGGGYIVSASNVVVDSVKPENWRSEVETVLKYGAYPYR